MITPHFLQGNCVNEQLTNVFKTDIDLQAHVASVHKEELGKSQQRQMRQIETNSEILHRAVIKQI